MPSADSFVATLPRGHSESLVTAVDWQPSYTFTPMLQHGQASTIIVGGSFFPTSIQDTIINPAAVRVFMASRLASLSLLEAAWNGPSSKALTETAKQNYSEFLRLLGADVRLDAEPVPTEDGGVRMEWDGSGRSYIAELQGDGALYLCVLGAAPQDDADTELRANEWTMDRLLAFFRDGTLDA
jgi:hypothetical protein